MKRLTVTLLLTDEQAASACRTLADQPTELDAGALRRAGLIDLDTNHFRVERVEDIPGRVGVQVENADGEYEIIWFDDERAQQKAAFTALKRFEKVRYVVEGSSPFEWPPPFKPQPSILEWAHGAAEEIHRAHTGWDRDADRYVREIEDCKVNDCVEACRVLGIGDKS
jgi:hypothetical protein